MHHQAHPPELNPNKICENLAVRRQPVLTVLEQQRIELSGPVAVRWISKIAAFLDAELDAELEVAGLESGSASTPRFALVGEVTWRTPLWILACWMRGLVATADPLEADLVIGTDDAVLQQAASQGALALALPLAPLEIYCERPLPPGVLDGNEEVASYPDLLEITLPTVPLHADLGAGITGQDLLVVAMGGLRYPEAAQPMSGATTLDQAAPAADSLANLRVAISQPADKFVLAARINALWLQEAAVVLVTEEATQAGAERLEAQLQQEKLDLDWRD